MQHFEHRLCTHVLNPAAGDEGMVSPLHIRRGRLDDAHPNIPTVTSFWKPSEAEMMVLLEGGCVTVCVLGHTAPPVMVAVEK